MLISYIIMGITCFGVMLALGEMSTKFPSKKGFAGHATRCVDPAFGFATALIYLCKVCDLLHVSDLADPQYLIISPNQIIASSLVLKFWNQTINGAAFVTIFIAFVSRFLQHELIVGFHHQLHGHQVVR